MSELLRRAARALIRSVKRFFTNSPANQYETVVFGAVRDLAFNFGKKATA